MSHLAALDARHAGHRDEVVVGAHGVQGIDLHAAKMRQHGTDARAAGREVLVEVEVADEERARLRGAHDLRRGHGVAKSD